MSWMTWDPCENTDETNLRFCWLRAVEWLNWPVFVSQTVAPILLLWQDWRTVVLMVLICNYLWVLLVRYHAASVRLAYLGVLAVRLKWVVCPAAGAYLWFQHRQLEAGLALGWPVLVMMLGLVPVLGTLITIPGQIGRVQTTFMAKLGYERRG